MSVLDEAAREQIDEALKSWRQGDCVVGEQWFLFRLMMDQPLTEHAEMAAKEGFDAAETFVDGFMVATQTCDIVRGCGERPYIEVCPLVKVDAEKLEEIRRGRRPSLAFLPGLADKSLVADLDRVMTVEKAVVASWERTLGCRDDYEVRRLSQALSRKRARAAFPDDFCAFASRLQRRLSSKHDNNSDEGRALRALREIRVQASPSWNAKQAEITFWFIRKDDEPMFESRGWDDYLELWLKLVPEGGRFGPVNGLVLTIDDLTARDYIYSDVLDLDHLSTREN